jgi:polysaccharide biosynthesis PFTS motif protein
LEFKNLIGSIYKSKSRVSKFMQISKFLILNQISGPSQKKIAVIYSLTEFQQKDVINIISRNGNIKKFPITKLNGKNYYIIESKDILRKSCKDAEIILFPYPLLFLILNFFLCSVITSLIKTISILFKRNMEKTWSLKETLILESVNSYIELDIFITISVLKDYPIEFNFPRSSRKYATHVIHYSQNSVEITFEDEQVPLPGNTMVDRDSVGDIHWVWTESYANYLRKFNNKIEFIAVGSITFKINEISLTQQRKRIITLFDVTPHTSTEDKSFYSFELAKRFIDDVIDVKNMNESLRDFEIQIKQKRQLNSEYHHKGYLDQLIKLESQNKIRIIPWDTNPFKIISESRVTISVPFTSIALIGKEIEVPSIYYYPFKRRISNYIYSDEIPLICGKDELGEFLVEELN